MPRSWSVSPAAAALLRHGITVSAVARATDQKLTTVARQLERGCVSPEVAAVVRLLGGDRAVREVRAASPKPGREPATA